MRVTLLAMHRCRGFAVVLPRCRCRWVAVALTCFLVATTTTTTTHGFQLGRFQQQQQQQHSFASSRVSTATPSMTTTTQLFVARGPRRLGRNGGGSGNHKRSTSESSCTVDAPPLRRNPPRKICLMVEPTPFTHVSGYANRFKEMLKFMNKAGDSVDILTVDSKTPSKDLPQHFLGYPIRHTQGFTFPLYNQISLTIDLPEMKGARIMDDFKPDLIHVTSPGFLLFAAMFYARVLCIPLVMSYHTHLPSYGKNYLGFIPGIQSLCWEVMRWAHSRADLTLVTSPQMQAELRQNGIPRVEVWRKGIDTERFHPQYQSATMRSRMCGGDTKTTDHVNDFVIVYVGRLGAEKRLKDIKAMLERMPNTRLCIVGKGPQQDELQQYFAGTPTVFMGQLSGDELSQAFASADVFVMPSDSETLGFVVLESMASGVPVVGAAAGGIPDLIDHGKTGFLVEPGNTDQFVHHLNLLRTNKGLRDQMGRASRQEAERWGWEAATSYLRNVQYERALINFHSRAFGGFGRPGTAGMWRLLGWRIRGIMRRLDRNVRGNMTLLSNWKRRLGWLRFPGSSSNHHHRTTQNGTTVVA